MVRYLALRDNLVPLEITGTASQRADRIQLVTLDDFDGRNWTVRADYRRAGTQFPDAPASSAPTREVTLDVRVLTPSSVGWLPRVGKPSRTSVAGLGYDPGTGDVVVPSDRETPSSYRITGREPIPGSTEVGADDPATTTADNLPLPPEVLTFVDTATAGRTEGLGQFLGLYQAMKNSGFSYDTSAKAPGGHGVRQIADLLKHKRGTSEQYASAFAVLSRHLGWDARVVLGFRPTWDGDRFRVRGQDVFAWAEVRFQRLGWVPVDPSPDRTVDEQGRPTADQPKSTSTLDAVPPPDQAAPREPGDEPSTGVAAPAPAAQTHLTTVALIVAAVLIVCLAAIPVAKAVRRKRRRRNGSARRHTVAAWQDAIEAMRGAGIPVNDRLTTGQVTGAAGQRLLPLLRPLADMVDRAAYAEEQIPDDAAAYAWHYTDTIRTEAPRDPEPRRPAAQPAHPRPTAALTVP